MQMLMDSHEGPGKMDREHTAQGPEEAGCRSCAESGALTATRMTNWPGHLLHLPWPPCCLSAEQKLVLGLCCCPLLPPFPWPADTNAQSKQCNTLHFSILQRSIPQNSRIVLSSHLCASDVQVSSCERIWPVRHVCGAKSSRWHHLQPDALDYASHCRPCCIVEGASQYAAEGIEVLGVNETHGVDRLETAIQ